MNDNKRSSGFNELREDDFPEWMWTIVDKHDLAVRTDSPFGAAVVLLVDAADLLKEVSLSAFRDNSITLDTRRRLKECLTMITDAEKLFPLCPTEPKPGTVTENEDGSLTRSAGPPNVLPF